MSLESLELYVGEVYCRKQSLTQRWWHHFEEGLWPSRLYRLQDQMNPQGLGLPSGLQAKVLVHALWAGEEATVAKIGHISCCCSLPHIKRRRPLRLFLCLGSSKAHQD